MTYPQPTDKLGDLALAIKALAEWADPRLPGTAIETIFLADSLTNVTGDVAVQFQTITNVSAVVTQTYAASGQAWEKLQCPVTTLLGGAPADTIWFRCVDNMGRIFANKYISVSIYGWGTPK